MSFISKPKLIYQMIMIFIKRDIYIYNYKSVEILNPQNKISDDEGNTQTKNDSHIW